MSQEAKNWFSMVAEIVDGGCDVPPAYNGWYLAMFPSSADALRDPALVADFYTSTNLGLVAAVGARRPRIGLFVVDTGGGPRVMAGPVARGYEVVRNIDQRGDDPPAGKRERVREPWARSYTAPAPAVPKIAAQTVTVGTGHDGREELWLAVRAVNRVAVTVELLDEHRTRVGAATVPAGGGVRLLRVSTDRALPPGGGMVTGLRVRAGPFSREFLEAGSYVSFAVGGAAPIGQTELERFEKVVEAQQAKTRGMD
jgi:hypothetical protein